MKCWKLRKVPIPATAVTHSRRLEEARDWMSRISFAHIDGTKMYLPTIGEGVALVLV